MPACRPFVLAAVAGFLLAPAIGSAVPDVGARARGDSSVAGPNRS